jgi:hypothetical protein
MEAAADPAVVLGAEAEAQVQALSIKETTAVWVTGLEALA